MSKPVVLIAEELSPATVEALGPDFEIRTCNGADRAALLAANPDADASAAARVLRGRCTAVVVTLGGAGALVVDDSGETTVPAPAAQVVDTTGAGDTFTGYLAAGLAAGLDLTSAARRAVVAGSISVERAVAVPSIPTADEVDERIR